MLSLGFLLVLALMWFFIVYNRIVQGAYFTSRHQGLALVSCCRPGWMNFTVLWVGCAFVL